MNNAESKVKPKRKNNVFVGYLFIKFYTIAETIPPGNFKKLLMWANIKRTPPGSLIERKLQNNMFLSQHNSIISHSRVSESGLFPLGLCFPRTDLIFCLFVPCWSHETTLQIFIWDSKVIDFAPSPPDFN